jgi:hypothetical protein
VVVLQTTSLDLSLTAEEMRVTKIVNKPYELGELLDVVAQLAT